MKRLITCLMVLVLLAGCGQADGIPVLRDGSSYGITAQIVPSKTGVPEPFVRTEQKEALGKHFHFEPQIIERIRYRDCEGISAGDPCRICSAGMVQLKERQEHEWRADRTVNCPMDTRVRDWAVRKSVTEVYTCDQEPCRFGFEVLLIYETISCRSEDAIKMSEARP